MTIYNGPVPTVSYSVQGGSPRLQALAQTLQYTENELNLTNELQKLRLGIVVNEQTLDSVRTSQQLGFGPISTPGYAACYARADSALKRALIPQLAQESTPAMAFELINLREQVQTEIRAEQNKAVPAARAEPPAEQNAQPLAPVAVAQTVAQQPTMTLAMVSTQPAPPRPTVPLEQQVLAFQQKVRQRIIEAQQRQAEQIQRMGFRR